MTRDEFVTILTSGLTKPPQYFFHDVAMNKGSKAVESSDFDSIVSKIVKPIKFSDVDKRKTVIIDARPAA